jgi:exonuclease 3'-5' domain-containing protein 2
LNLEQIRYAASDSYAGIQLFIMMEAKRKRLDPCPPRPYHAEKNIPIRTAQDASLVTEDSAEAESEVSGEESKPEEPETPAPVKRKYKKKAVPYFSPESSEIFDFEDRALENAIEANNATIPNFTARKRTSKQKAMHPVPKKEVVEDSEEPTSNESLLQNAEAEALSHLSTSSSAGKQQPTLTTLRTYFLWSQNPSLELGDIAKMITDTRLTNQAVARRVLEVATWFGEDVELDGERIKIVLRTWREMGFDGDVWEDLEVRIRERAQVVDSDDSDDGFFESMKDGEDRPTEGNNS